MLTKKVLAKNNVLVLGFIAAVIVVGAMLPKLFKNEDSFSTLPATYQPASVQITAQGSIVSQNQESLHFQTSGKLVYLPFAEGDQVNEGQAIAGLDSLEAQKNVTAAEASYRSAKAALDLVLDNIHLFQYGNGGFANVGSSNETQTQKTQRQQAEEAVNAAYDNLQKATNQLANMSLTAPFAGTIVHEDIRNTGVNIIPTNIFTLADLSKLVFQAQVSDSDMAFISVGDKAIIRLDSVPGKEFAGNVLKIYPEKIKLPSGGNGYKVDIGSDGLLANAKFGDNGLVIFENTLAQKKVLPSWTVLRNQYVWMMDQNTPKLQQVKVGETVGNKLQILEGLSDKDKAILDPEVIVKKKYWII